MKIGSIDYGDDPEGPVALWERAVKERLDMGMDVAHAEQDALAQATRRAKGLGVVTPASRETAALTIVGFSMVCAGRLLEMAGMSQRLRMVELAFGGAAAAGIIGKEIGADLSVLASVMGNTFQATTLERRNDIPTQ